MGVSVPKKRTALAVNRNRVKRLVHEAWRLNKHHLYPIIPADTQLHLFFVFTGTPNPDFKTIEHAVLKSIEMLNRSFPLIASESNE
jgi:ribonuclease P protein component